MKGDIGDHLARGASLICRRGAIRIGRFVCPTDPRSLEHVFAGDQGFFDLMTARNALHFGQRSAWRRAEWAGAIGLSGPASLG